MRNKSDHIFQLQRLRRKRGCCDVCFAWDDHDKSRISKSVADHIGSISAILPTYFDNFHTLEQNGRFSNENGYYTRGSKLESPKYVRMLMNYIKQHRLHHDVRNDLTENSAEKLKNHEHDLLSYLGADLEDTIRPLAFHWGLRDRLRHDFHLDEQNPKPNTLYWLWDHKEHTIIQLTII